MSGPARVAHLITRMDVGGAQATAIRTCALLDRERFAPMIFTGADGGSGGSSVPDAEAAGIEVRHVPHLVSRVRPGADLRAVGSVRALLAEHRIDLLHTHSSKAGAIGRWAARRGPWPTVHTVHGWSFHDGQPTPVAAAYRFVERHLAPRTGALVVVADADRRTGLAAGIGRPEQYHLVRSGIAPLAPPSPSERAAARRLLGWEADVHGWLSVGRLVEQKDPLALLEAFALVVADSPHVRLALVGDGDLRPVVEARAAAPDLAGRVAVLGLRSDVPTLLAAADGYASAARWEGLPRAVVEAAFRAVPLAVTDVGGLAEVVRDRETGRLVAAGDPRALAHAVREIVGDPARAAERADRAREAVAGFDEATMAAQTAAIYDGLLGGSR